MGGGGFFYEATRKQTKGEYKVTGACIGEERKSDGELLLKRSQEFGKNPKEPTIQLQSLRGRLAVIAYRKWDFKTLALGEGGVTKLGKQNFGRVCSVPERTGRR